MDPHLPDALLREAPGILAWAVEGCLRWRAEGLRPPAAVREATAAYREQFDDLHRFLMACCRPEGQTLSADLYAAYLDWCAREGEAGMSKRRFGIGMGKRCRSSNCSR